MLLLLLPLLHGRCWRCLRLRCCWLLLTLARCSLPAGTRVFVKMLFARTPRGQSQPKRRQYNPTATVCAFVYLMISDGAADDCGGVCRTAFGSARGGSFRCPVLCAQPALGVCVCVCGEWDFKFISAECPNQILEQQFRKSQPAPGFR